MKKFLFAMFAVTFIVASCSKESKLNKRLDGEWNVTKADGAALPAGVTMVVAFSKEKKGKGTYTWTVTMPPAPAVPVTGSYSLEKDEKIYMTTTGSTDQDTMIVDSYSKTDMKLKSPDGTETMELVKK